MGWKRGGRLSHKATVAVVGVEESSMPNTQLKVGDARRPLGSSGWELRWREWELRWREWVLRWREWVLGWKRVTFEVGAEFHAQHAAEGG